MKTREEQLQMAHSILMSCGLVSGEQPPEGTRYRCPLCDTLSVISVDHMYQLKSHHTNDCILPKILREIVQKDEREYDYALYAFWKYDQFPYVLGGEVRTFLEDGSVTIQGYDGMAFTPVKLLPVKSGLAIREELNAVKEAYRVDQQKILEDALRKLDKVAPWATQRK